jgi:predicted adenine nucleotide alpha hydrolase (AANH) superfamily ATPase
MEKIMFHVCCAPCFVAPYFRLREEFEITALWFNPNIHPLLEYNKRRDTVREFVRSEKVGYIERDEYGLIEFTRKSAFNEEKRCEHCYYDRLSFTARTAKKEGFDWFSTSLLYSKYQKHELIKEIAFDVAKRHEISFYYQDLRELWGEGIKLSKEQGMYRQQYCGCVYSEMERYTSKQ